MALVSDIIACIEKTAPLRYQDEWDNSGLQVGFPEEEVKGILVCLDVTEEIVDEARRKGCNLILSHHPLIFKALKQVSDVTYQQRCVVKALASGIAIYSAHTSLDNARGGVNYMIAAQIGLQNLEWLSPGPDDEYGSGVIGNLPAPEEAGSFLRRLKAVFVRTQDRAQAFYAETLAALGYKQNAEPFRRLAEMLPWRELPESQEAAIASLSCVAEMAVPNVAAWRWSNVRPANSLKRRIAAAASLFSGTCPSLLERLDACDLTVRAGQRAACDVLCASGLLGARRAAAILANVIVPFALAEGRIGSVPTDLPPEETNATVRLTAFRLLGRDHNPALYSGNGILLQGLIQLHRDFCLSAHPDCASCELLNTFAIPRNSTSTNYQQKEN